jgi:DHA2 family multidrug resistance protein-like MFS transporter
MDTTTVAGSAVRAGRREWIGLAVLALPTLLLALDFSVLFLALPHLSADLAAGSTQILWIQDIYGFMVAGFLVTMGTLGDRIGRRRLLLMGALAFGILSVLAAYSVSAEMLIALRALLGIAGASMMPSILALISQMFRDDRQRTTAISLWVTCLLAGVAIGPVVGGVLLQMFWWGSAFLIGVPVMVLLLLTGPVLLPPDSRDPGAGRIDLISVVLSLAAILPVVYALKEIAKDGFSPARLGVMAAGLVVGLLFIRRQRRLPFPLLDLRLFTDRAFTAALAILLLGTIAIGGIGFLFSQYLQLVQGLSPLQTGLWLIPDAMALIIGAQLTPVIASRIGPAYTVAAGLIISAAGFLLLSQVTNGTSTVIAVTGLAATSLGIAPILVLGTDLVLGSAPPHMAGSASSLSETSSELGIALGVAVLGSIGTAIYRADVSVPPEVPAQAAEAASDTLVGATAAAAELPDQVAAAVLGPAQEAFTAGLNVAAAVSVPVLLLLAIGAVIMLRKIRPAAAEPEPVPETPALPGADSASADEVVTAAGTTTDEVVAAAGTVTDELVVVAGNGHSNTLAPSPGRQLAVTGDLGHPLPQGVLARHGDLVLLCEAAPGQGQQVGMLVDVLVDVATNQPCGQLLSRRLASLLSANGSNGFPALCAFGPTEGGIAAVVHGHAELTITAGGRQLRLDGREAVTLVDRVVTEPVESMRAIVGELTDLYIDRFGPPSPNGDTAVPTAAVPTAAVPTAAETPSVQMPVDETTTGETALDETAIDESAVNATDPAPPDGLTQAPAGPDTQPNIVLPDLPDGPHPQDAAENQVVGVRCKHDHFNDSSMAYCMVCGISMAQSEKVPVLGIRPALGVLVLDDGTTYSLERAYVFGRAPETDEMVASGKASPVRLADPMMSRVHARVVLDGWEVWLIDTDSTNGTFVCPPGQLAWTRLSRGASMALQPGAMAAFGRRRLRYHSYRNW